MLGCGTQFGKTVVGGMRMRLAMLRNPGAENAFLITAPTYKILSQSTLPAFLSFMSGLGGYNKKDDIFELNSGAKCYCRTETDPDSIVGITSIRHIWCDEAGKYRLYFWENIQARADFLGATIDLTTSPYSMNWIYREIVKPTLAGKRKDVELVQAASWENPYHSLHKPEARQLKKDTMDPRRFNMIYGGEWSRMEGLVYDCWDDSENLIDAFQLPSGTKYYGGIDWGFYPDPFVLLVRAVTPEGRHYGISEFVKNRLTLADIIRILKQKKQIFGIEKFFCDPSQPGHIEELNRNGIPAIGAVNSIRQGIDVHYELTKMRLYKEFKGACPHTADERDSYHYPDEKDLGPDQNAKELLPVDAKNHTMDASRYLSISLHRGGKIHTPIVPGEKLKPRNQELPFERLQRIRKDRSKNKEESWN